MGDDARSRRDLFRLFGRPLSKLAGLDGGSAPPPDAEEAPVERGRLVIDLALRPIPVGTGRRFLPAIGGGSVLVAGISDAHLAAVDGDCPRCGGALRYEPARDAVLCPAGCAAFRLDGSAIEGPPGLRLRSLPVHRAGPRVEVVLAT